MFKSGNTPDRPAPELLDEYLLRRVLNRVGSRHAAGWVLYDCDLSHLLDALNARVIARAERSTPRQPMP